MRPLLSVLLGDFAVSGSFINLAEHLAKSRVGGKRGNSLHRQVRIVRKRSGEVVGNNLLFWIQALFLQVFCPRRKERPILGSVVRVPVRLGERGRHQDHVRAFSTGMCPSTESTSTLAG